MSTTAIWRTKELHILRKHYPDMGILTVKLNKSAHKINKKAEELGLMVANSNRKCHRGGDHRSKAYKASNNTACKLYEPKHRSVEEIDADIAQVEDRISKGIDNGQAWNSAIQQYNSLCLEYSRALKVEPKRKTKISKP